MVRRVLQDEEDDSVININIIPGESSDPENLNFNLSLESYTSQAIALQLNFDYPDQVSKSSYDVIEIVIKETDLFFDEQG